MENWKPVKGYEDCYAVSDLGRVKRISGLVKTSIKHSEYKMVHERILKQNKKRNGYLTVDLSKNNVVKTISVHKLVATAFCDKKENDTQVNHINCNKQDNRAVNLEWCTGEENRKHAKENNLYNNPNKKKVRCKQLNKIFESSYKAAEFINFEFFKNSKQTKNLAAKIRAACCGMQKSAYGFTWEQV